LQVFDVFFISPTFNLLSLQSLLVYKVRWFPALVLHDSVTVQDEPGVREVQRRVSTGVWTVCFLSVRPS